MRKSLALIRANWLTALSYRLETFFSVMSLFLAIIPLYFVSGALQPMMSGVIQSQAPEYFGFIIVGGLTVSFVRTAVTAPHSTLGGEISTGSFEALLGTPTGLVTLLTGMVGQAFCMIALRTGVAFLFAMVFGLRIVWSATPAAMLALSLIVMAHLPFGIMAAALVLAFRATGPFPGGLIGVSILLGGVYYPTEVVPSWIARVSDLIPLTYGLRALRRSLLDGAPLSASATDLTVISVMAVVFMAISLAMFRWALGYAKRTGTLAQYYKMQPFFFGTSQEQIFGVYHPPEGRVVRNAGVVLCHPLGHEYLRAHRAFRNLAAALAGQGFHVLRFDYFGSGDSGGSADQTTVKRCLADLGSAIQELKDISGASKVSLVGLRFGATFAALAASTRRDIDRLLLWDPVIDGRAYVEELFVLQRDWLHDRLGTAKSAGPSELIGFALTDAIRAELESTSLVGLPKVSARSVALVLSGASPVYGTLKEQLERDQADVSCTIVDESNEWQRVEMVHQILLPHVMVRTITSALSS